MGLAIIHTTLYISSFAGPDDDGHGEVFSMPLQGGALQPFLTGFEAPIVALGASGGRLYVGEVSGQMFSVKP